MATFTLYRYWIIDFQFDDKQLIDSFLSSFLSIPKRVRWFQTWNCDTSPAFSLTKSCEKQYLTPRSIYTTKYNNKINNEARNFLITSAFSISNRRETITISIPSVPKNGETHIHTRTGGDNSFKVNRDKDNKLRERERERVTRSKDRQCPREWFFSRTGPLSG